MPELTPAVEKLLRTIAEQGEGGATFEVMARLRYRLVGTDYVVNQRSFYPLTGDGYVSDNDNDSAPVKLTDKGRKWMADHPVPRGGRGPYKPSRARRPRPVLMARPARQLPAKRIHDHMGLSYANYLVLPRTLLQSMPEEWQGQFVALLERFDDAFGHVPQAEAYIVQAAEEKVAYDLDVTERAAARVSADSDEDDTTYTHTSLIGEMTTLGPDDRALVPTVDPVPHYNRGRTRVEPRISH
jgi:hypothetical protein